MYQTEDNKLQLNLAGFKKEEILIEQEDNILTIKSVESLKISNIKRKFHFQLRLPTSDTVKAHLEDGILEIEFPPKTKTKIEIT